mgnify:FL=1
MSPPLTLVPATLPGVVRRGTPLATVEPVFVGGVACAAGMQCTTGGPTDSAGRVRAICAFGSISLPVACLAVDLTDSTGRAHGLRAILLSEGYPDSLCEECTFREIGDGWAIYRGGDWLCGWLLDYGLFDGIGRDDDRRLPDGSLWRRAEALARVLLHVLAAGGAQ